jgi:hypothetical protein
MTYDMYLLPYLSLIAGLDEKFIYKKIAQNQFHYIRTIQAIVAEI